MSGAVVSVHPDEPEGTHRKERYTDAALLQAIDSEITEKEAQELKDKKKDEPFADMEDEDDESA